MTNTLTFKPIHEQIILGVMLTNKTTRTQLVNDLKTNTFFAPNHQILFSAIAEIEEQGLECIPATIISLIPNDCDIHKDYLDALEDLGKSVKNIDYHIERAKWDVVRNNLFKDNLGEIESYLKDPKADIDDVSRRIRKMENALSTIKTRRHIVGGAPLAATYKATSISRDIGHHIKTSGYPILDEKLTYPFSPGFITTLTAAPAIGKTTFALNMARRQAKKFKVGYLAWESGEVEATDILCSAELKIPLSNLAKNRKYLSEQNRKDIDEYVNKLYTKENSLSYLEYPPDDLFESVDIAEVNNKVINYVDRELDTWGLDIMYWDLFEVCFPDTRPFTIMWCLNRMKKIAKKHQVHIVLIHQILFKEVERRKNKRPTRDALKGTGGYIERSDIVLALYRHAIYNRGIDDNEIELESLKQRQGEPSFRLGFGWDGRNCRVSGGREIDMNACENEDTEYENL